MQKEERIIDQYESSSIDNIEFGNHARSGSNKEKNPETNSAMQVALGWSEKQKSWKMQKARADSKSRHTTDFRTVFEIMIGRFVSCEIGQTYFTESGVRFGTLERPDFRSFS